MGDVQEWNRDSLTPSTLNMGHIGDADCPPDCKPNKRARVDTVQDGVVVKGESLSGEQHGRWVGLGTLRTVVDILSHQTGLWEGCGKAGCRHSSRVVC